MRFDQDSIIVDDETTTIDIPDGDSNAPTSIVMKSSKSTGNENVITRGKIQILNTLESFKSTDKNELLNKFCLDFDALYDAVWAYPSIFYLPTTSGHV